MNPSLTSDRVSGKWWKHALHAVQDGLDSWGRLHGKEPAPSYNKQDLEKLCKKSPEYTACDNLHYLRH